MIIVTGTRRSGTSLWMQILERSGIQYLGDKFPANWESLAKKANPRGYFESTLVRGINYHTNPDPRSGAWLSPDNVRDVAVKVFADGLVKTDFAYINKVIVSVRNWRDCEASQQRMDEILGDESGATDITLPVGFRWWVANFSLLRDLQTRRYPAAVFAFEDLLSDPERIVADALGWLGRPASAEAASVVEASLRTQADSELPDIDHDYGSDFDELYAVLRERRQIDRPFYDMLEATDRRIAADINARLSG